MGCGVYGSEYRVAGLELRVAGLELRVPSIGFRVSGFQGSDSKEKSDSACSHEACAPKHAQNPDTRNPEPEPGLGVLTTIPNPAPELSTSGIVVICPVDVSFEPSLDALSLLPDVTSSIKFSLMFMG